MRSPCNERTTLRGHSNSVQAVAFAQEGKLLASASGDGTVKLWNVSAGRLLATLNAHSNWVHALAITSNGRLLASGSHDCTVKLWDCNMFGGK
jgi:WD40 repeat protein